MQRNMLTCSKEPLNIGYRRAGQNSDGGTGESKLAPSPLEKNLRIHIRRYQNGEGQDNAAHTKTIQSIGRGGGGIRERYLRSS